MMGVEGLHVLFGSLWFGGALFASFVVMPATKVIDGPSLKGFNQAYAKNVVKVMSISAILIIVLGVLLGFYLHVGSRLGSSYGLMYALAN